MPRRGSARRAAARTVRRPRRRGTWAGPRHARASPRRRRPPRRTGTPPVGAASTGRRPLPATGLRRSRAPPRRPPCGRPGWRSGRTGGIPVAVWPRERERTRGSVQGAEVEHPRDEIGVAPEPPTWRRASPVAPRRRRRRRPTVRRGPTRTPMFRAAAAPRRAEASTRWKRGSRSDQRCDTGASPVVGAVVGHHDFPSAGTSWVDRAWSCCSIHGMPFRTGTTTLISG